MPPPTRPGVLSSNQVRFIIIATLLAFLYRSLTQRSPVLFLSTPPPLPLTHGCVIHHPDILKNCEDFSHLPGTPYVFLSCDKARREFSPAFGSYSSKAPAGEIYLWDYITPGASPILVSGHASLGGDFHPLGLSAVKLSEDSARVFITNQAKASASVEVLDVLLTTGESHHIKTVVNAKIHSPNGIAAYNATSFYVGNHLFMARRWSIGVLIEILLGIPGGQVLYISLPSESFEVGVEKGQKDSGEMGVYPIMRACLANGIAYNPDESRLYIASSTHGVYTFSLPSPTEPWAAYPHSFHRTPFATDNLFYSHAQKKLYASGVSSISAFVTAMKSPIAPRGPSWTIELLSGLPRLGEIEEAELNREKAFRAVDPANTPLRHEERRWRSVFMDDGEFFGGMSTGGVVDEEGRFVAVSLVGEGVMVCPGVLKRRGTVEPVEEEKDEL